MIVSFCGHSKYIQNSDDEMKIIEILKNRIGDTPCDFFLGEYGAFDIFCYRLARKFKENHKNVKLIFITPYASEAFLKKRCGEEEKRFDLVIYPELENVPKKFAISYRNRWITKKSDIIISYVNHKFGGAYAMYRYAKRLGKEIYNIAKNETELCD